MEKQTVQFDVGLINDYSADIDNEFAIMRLEYLSDGYNSHDVPITTEILKRDASTILGKFIVAKYDRFTNDVMGHETDEAIVGYIPNNAMITFKETTNGNFACVDGVISKLYAKNVYDLYKQHNHRAVSVEMTLEWKDHNPDTHVLESLNITGVTLLGLTYDPACTLASSKMVQFSKQANDFYTKFQADTLNTFVKQRQKKMAGKTYKVNTTELKENDWGNVDKTKLRNTIMEASNRSRLVKDVYAIVEAGWEESPSQKLKYPLMELIGDTFYYNRYALSSALAYARQNNESQVVSKVLKLYKKFGLEDTNKEGEGEVMANQKLTFGTDEFRAEVMKKVKEHEGADCKCEELSEDMLTYSVKDKVYCVETDFGEDCKDPEKCKCELKWSTKKEKEVKKEKKMSEEEEMSSDANVDPSALAELLEREAARNKELAAKIMEKDNIIMQYKEELTELRKFKEETMSDQKAMTVESVMAEIQGMVSEQQFNDLKKEGEECKCEAIDAWANKAKAMAFEANHKTTKEGGLWRMAAPQREEPRKGIWGRL